MQVYLNLTPIHTTEELLVAVIAAPVHAGHQEIPSKSNFIVIDGAAMS